MLEVLERSAATFGGVLKGDVLLQVDDKVVSGKEDIVRYFTFFFPHCFNTTGGIHLDLAHFRCLRIVRRHVYLLLNELDITALSIAWGF